jgi:hypothetical protein
MEGGPFHVHSHLDPVENTMTYIRGSVALLALCALLWPVDAARAQGVTTGAISGIVTNTQQQPVAGASVIAIHEPSGTSYEGVTRGDGRFSIPGMRVGGPYSVTVAYTGAGGTAFAPETQTDVQVNLGVATDLDVTVQPIAVTEEVTVSAVADPVFSSSRTGASTAVMREEIEILPTISGRIGDITRLTPQAANSGGFLGQDSRMNNITVDGSSFNATMGISSSQPGDRTGVAPISLEAIEQVQVNVAPFDVRQGSFVGAGVNTVTRSGTNEFSGSFYHRMRNQDWVGTEAAGRPVNPGTFTFRNTGGWASGPIIRNRWFAFGTYEDEKESRPLLTFRANRGGEPVGGQVTRVLASDLQQLSDFLSGRFNYETGPFEDINDDTPAKRFLLRSDLNINSANKVSFRYNQLDSFTDVAMSSSTSALRGRTNNTTSFLSFQNSNYQVIEDIRSAIGEWNAVIGGTMANSFQSGFTYQDESRASRGSVFPLVDIFEAGTAYTTFGFEPFTFQNELRYSTFQLQDNFTKFAAGHTLTLGGYLEKFHSDNVFWNCCPQSGYQYNSLADFYTDANGFLANANRTVSPVVLGRFHLRWTNIPNLDKPLQPLDVWYTAGYAQDEWRPKRNLTVTTGLRFDRSQFENTAFPNPAANALTFRDEQGNPVQYDTGSMPDPKILWSPRAGINWDVRSDQTTQVRGGTGLFSGRPAYVWISNQLGNTGVLIGERIVDNTTAFPFNPNPDAYKPTNVTGGGASSYALNVTDSDFKFPQVWRNNIAVDRRLPFGLVSTTEYIYARDVNGIYYINANLPAPQATFSGVDARPRWVGVACAAAGQAGGCVNRINNDPGNQVTVAHVLKNGSGGHSWSISQSLSKVTAFGLSLRGAYSYGVSKSLVDPESTAATSYARVATSTNPNDPIVERSLWSPGHRVFALASYSREYFSFGATSFSLFWEARHNQASGTPSSRISYVFAGDMNNDSVTANDLIYIPRDTSEMNFVTFTQGGRTFTAEEQAAAFERFIQQDPYLRKHRGEYAGRYAAVMPMLSRADLSLVQDVFHDIAGKRNGLQIRLDITNVGNLLNSNWGVGQSPVAPVNTNNQVQVLTSPGVDAQGRANYRLAVVNNELLTGSFQKAAFTSDVYQFMVSLRYSFN